ncbi:MAG: autotransporter outer membrane beta-barrel domain-containing protein [Paracoccaceae bacterium]
MTAGTVASVTQSGGTTTVSGTGTVTGLSDINGGTLTNSATVGAVDVAAGATFDNNGTAGAVTNAGALLLSGTAASLDNSGTTTVDGASTVAGSIANSGTFNATANLTFGDFTNGATGTVAVNAPVALQGGAFTNSGTLFLSGGASLTTPLFTNTGNFNLGSGITNLNGNLTTTGAVSLANGTSTDTLQISGNAILNGDITLEANLTGEVQGANPVDTIDTITVTGTVSGTAEVDIVNVGAGSVSGQDLTFLTYSAGDSGNLSFTLGEMVDANGNVMNTPDSAVLYRLNSIESASGGGQVDLQSFANPGIGGLASGLYLTHSLIGTVVNRPSSAYLTSPAGPGDNCTVATWARLTGGRADLNGDTANAVGTFTNSLTADYAGFLLGADNGCYNGHYNGWNLTYGAMFGYNEGGTVQPVFAFDSVTNQLDYTTVTSITTTDFEQTFGGVYLAATRGSWTADLQYRYEDTRFDVRNSPVAGFATGLGIDNQTYVSRGHTFSGSLAYTHQIGNNGWAVRPLAGFALSQFDVDDIRFSNGAGAADDGLLRIGSINQAIGYGQLLVAKQNILASGNAALTYFGTATVYNDFSGGTVSQYFAQLNNGVPVGNALESTSSNIGTFGEIGLGVSYAEILNSGSSLPPRQLDLSGRVDGRLGDSLSSWGLTAQVRLQF